MNFVTSYYYSVACVAILITHEAISPVNGQSTVQGSDNGDQSTSVVAEMIQQLRVDLFDQLNKQVQRIHERFDESLQDMKSQHDVIVTNLHTVDRRFGKHGISTRNQTWNSRTFANGSCDPAADVCDCSDIKASGQSRSGVYEVCVGLQHNRTCTSAFCEMETANGASLVFQRRKDGSVPFIRAWTGYRDGFGNPDGEFWLGNKMLNLLTSKRNYKLRVDLEDFNGTKSYAEYSTFSINSLADKYRLRAGGYSGNAGDGLKNHNEKQFSTIDEDNDDDSDFNCAQMFGGGGGWWFFSCYSSNLNGIYRLPNGTFSSRVGHWSSWNGSDYLKVTEMKLVPVA